MTYVISDLHGYPLNRFKELLNKANFTDNDFLYILGDTIDRNGDGGVEMMCWLAHQSNIQMLLGNHEAMLLSCSFVFDEITNDTLNSLSAEKIELLQNYQLNGGDVTLKQLHKLSKASPEKVEDIFDFIRDLPVYDALSVNGTDYFLVHGGFDNFSVDKKISDYSLDELIFSARPDLHDEYYPDFITVVGHTPTMIFGEEYNGKIYKNKTWIDIDMGVSYGNEPVLLRLDDMAQFRNR